ncbi:MAG: hypothetical protein AB1331_09770 [Bacillota bacterium]
MLASFDPDNNRVLAIDLSLAGLTGHRSMDPMNMVKCEGGEIIHTRMFSLRRPGLVIDSHALPPVPVLEDAANCRLVLPLPNDLSTEPGGDAINYHSNGLKIELTGVSLESEGRRSIRATFPAAS